MRRATAAVSATLLALLAVALAEAALLVLLLVFSSILGLNLVFDLGPPVMDIYRQPFPQPGVNIHEAAALVSVLFAFVCGAAAAGWRYRHWRPL